MAIKTVTQANLAEFVASRPSPSALSTAQAVTDAVQAGAPAAPTPGNPVIKPGVAETITDAPIPGEQPTPEQLEARKTKAKNGVQERIDELVRERHELDEAFQAEYEQRLRLEGELSALKSQAPAPKPEPPKDELGPEPKAADFTTQEEFLAAWGKWQRKAARQEFAEEQNKAKREEQARQAEAAMAQKVARATADLPDFQSVIEAADKRTRGDLPTHIRAAIYESDVGAHIAYHLAKDPKEEKRIFGLPVAKALLELGKIEQQYQKSGKAEQPPAITPSIPETPTTPQPVPRLKESPGVIPVDLSKPMDFLDYKAARLEQIRAQGRRRH